MAYKPYWESLQAYEVPQWFMDEKLGIFIHWGVYAVPAFGNEWYPRNTYIRDNPAYEHHRQSWGDHKQFGYKDFVPMFKAENWDPEQWLDLFEESGAKYIVPVAEHHDGFPMYDTQFTSWNAAKMGPCRDTVAELAAATRARGLHFGVSSHRAFNWRYYTFDDEFDTVDPEGLGLYGEPHPADHPCSLDFLEDWFGRTKELIDKFEPDVLWFDFGWHQPEFTPYWPEVAAYYYNRALEWNKGVVLQYKDKFPDGVAVYDVERGKLSGIREDYWQTDTSVSYKSWSYIDNDEFKTVTTLVHDLVDIVSKNGNLLLNVGPRADGTIPDEAADCLRGLGKWLDTNGEAIYRTRHWEVFGEGETEVATGHHTERDNAALTAADIRFTQKDGTVYAICMGSPSAPVTIKSLGLAADTQPGKVASVTLVGSDAPVEWSQDAAALTASSPAAGACAHAATFKVEFE